MAELLYRAYEIIVWGGTLLLVLYWLWAMRRAKRPVKLTREERAELASLREAVGRVARPGKEDPAAPQRLR